MPNYGFECKSKKCKVHFEQICTFKDFDAGFPDVRCPACKSKKVGRVMGDSPPAAMFANPRESSKWANWSYRQGKTWEEAKMTRAAAEAANKGPMPYKKIDDTDGGRRMNFID